MIERREPELLQTLPRLLARLSPNDSRIEEFRKQLYRIEAGYSGEKSVDRFLESLELPNSTIVSDLHLALSPHNFFQIDSLILTRHCILLLEIKNIAGELRFVSNPHQLERTLPTGVETIMDCPLSQLETNTANLQIWLAKRGVNVEISGRVVIASKNGKVRIAPPNSPIIYKRQLANLLREKLAGPAVYTQSQLQQICELIQKNQMKFNPYPLCEYYQIDPRSLKKGQLCSVCAATMVYKSHKQRKCHACGIIEATNYKRTMKDWFILMDDSISNRECRDFLQLKNKDDAYYAIKTLPLIKVGNSVATRYYWPEEQPHN